MGEDHMERVADLPTDEELVRRAREGDETAFEALVERRTPALRRRIRRQLPALLRRKVAESDVLQAAYFTASERLADFEDRGPGSFQAWLDTIVDLKIRGLLGRYRGTAKRALDREISRAQRPATVDARARMTSPSQAAVAGELRQKIRYAMERLPEDYRRVLELVRHQQRPLQEVGLIMDRSPKAVSKLLARATARLERYVFGDEENGDA